MADSDNLTRVTKIGDHELVLTDVLYEIAFKDDVAIYLFTLIPAESSTVVLLNYDARLEIYNLDDSATPMPPVPYTFGVHSNPTPEIGTPAGTSVGASILAVLSSTAVTARTWAQGMMNPMPISDQLAP